VAGRSATLHCSPMQPGVLSFLKLYRRLSFSDS
jgi:hypothetical protein